MSDWLVGFMDVPYLFISICLGTSLPASMLEVNGSAWLVGRKETRINGTAL